MDIFFVLSGFLITSILLTETRQGGIRVGQFYLRRALRLFPAVAALLVVVSIYNHLHGEPVRTTERSILAVGLYVVNWVKTFGPDVSPGLGQTWSLAVEEQFYLVWPFVIAFIVRKRWSPRLQLIMIAVLCLACGFYRATLWNQDATLENAYFRTDARFDALLIGAALAVAWHHNCSLRWARQLSPFAASILIALAIFPPEQPDWAFYGGFTVVAICSAVLIAAVLNGSEGKLPALAGLLAWRPAQWLGRISYGVYLWHVLVLNVAVRLPGPWWIRGVVAVAVSLLAGQASRTFVERPFLNLKDRLPHHEAIDVK